MPPPYEPRVKAVARDVVTQLVSTHPGEWLLIVFDALEHLYREGYREGWYEREYARLKTKGFTDGHV